MTVIKTYTLSGIYVIFGVLPKTKTYSIDLERKENTAGSRNYLYSKDQYFLCNIVTIVPTHS